MPNSTPEVDQWAAPTTPAASTSTPGVKADPAVDQWASPVAAQVRNNLQFSTDANADQEAQYRHLARFTGTPIDSVRADPATVRVRASLLATDADRLAAQAPKTADVLTDPSVTKMLHDDIPNVMSTEGAIRALAAARDYMFSTQGYGGNNLVTDTGNLLYSGAQGLAGSFNALEKFAGLTAGAVPVAIDAANNLGRDDRHQSTPLSDWWFAHFVAPADANRSAFDLAPDASAPQKVVHGVGNLLGLLSQVTLSGGGAAEPAAAATVGDFLTGAVEHAARSMALPATSAAVNTGADVLEQTGDATAAARSAITQYLVATAQGIAPLSAPGGLLARTAGGAITMPLTSEVGREATNAALPDQMHQDFSIENAVVDAITGGAMGGFMGPRSTARFDAAMRDAVRWTYSDHAAALHAAQSETLIQKLGELATQGKFRERDPEAFRQFVSDVADDAGSPDLYVDAKTFAQVLDQSGVTANALGIQMPAVAAQMREGLQTEGMVRIPIEDYATHIAGGPVDAALQPHLRTDPAGMTMAAAKTFLADQATTMKDQVAGIVDDKAKRDAFTKSGDQVEKAIREQLDEAKIGPAEVNASYAAHLAAYYTATAQRMNILPTELLAAHPVNIRNDALGPLHQAVIEKPPRASYDPATNTISILKDADLSSFLHEAAHHFLEIHGRIAASENAPESIRSDIEALTGSAKWADLPLSERAELHEKFARSFEAHLLDGVAPSPQMQSLFSRFRSWILHAYRNAVAPKFELSPEVHAIMDRMLASDEAIRQAEAVRGMKGMFAEKPPGMSDEAFAAYKALGDQATAGATENFQARSLRDMKWLSGAKSRALKALQSQADAARTETRAQVTAEVDAMPAFQAKAFLDEATDPQREHKAALAAWRTERDAVPKADQPAWLETHPRPERAPTEADAWEERRSAAEAAARADEREKAGAGKTGIEKGQALAKAKRAIDNAVERRMLDWEQENPKPRDKRAPPPDLEITADKFGFNSAAEMLQAIHDVGSRKEAIDGLTDQRMLQEHGELIDPVSVERAAEAAIHSDMRAKFIATELNALAKATGSPGLLARAAREAAEASIAGKLVKNLRPAQYTVAEGKVSRLADKFFRAGDVAMAAIHKRAQLLSNALAKSAGEAKTEVADGLKYLARFDKATTRARLSGEFLQRIDEIRALVDLRKSPGENRSQQRLQEWADGLRATGYEPQIAEWLAQLATPKSYKDLTVEEFRGVVAAVESLEHIAREQKKATVGGQKVDLRDVVDNRLIPRMDERGERFTKQQLVEPPRAAIDGYWAALTHWLGVKMRLVDADLKPQEFKFNRYDMHELDGPFREALLDRFLDANYRKVDLTKQVSDAAGKVGKELGKDWQKSLYDVVPNTLLPDPDLSKPGALVPMKITRGRMLGIARHVGNESNFDKLTKGYGWAPADVWRFLRENMTAKDWRATQAHWDAFEPLWKETEAMVRRLGGVPPPKIPAREFTITTPAGETITMRGGYSPIDYDPLRSKLSVKKGEFSLDPSDKVGEMTAYRATTTSNGSLTNRAQGYTDRVSLDFHSSDARIRDTIHDLAYREALLDATKIVNDEAFRNKFLAVYGPQEYQALTTWLKNVRDTNVEDPRTRNFDKAMQYTRQGVVLTGIGYRVSTVLKHGGAAALKSLGYLGSGEGAAYFGARLARMASGHAGEDIAAAKEKFGEIRTRALQMDRDYKVGSRSMYEAEDWRAKNDRFGHWMVATSDLLSAVPTAWAAYDLAITKGVPKSMGGTGEAMSEAEAVRYANSVVRQAHGSALEVTRSNFIQARGAKGFFGALYGFMNNTYGQMGDMLDKSVSGGHFKNNPAVAARLLATLIVPALWTQWLKSGNPGDDESYLAWAGKAIAGEVGAMVPFVRDAVSLLEGGHSGSVAPIQAMTDVVNSGKDIWNEAQGKSTRLIQDMSNAIGEWAHVAGLGQLGHILQYMRDVADGKKEQPDSVLGTLKEAAIGGKPAKP